MPELISLQKFYRILRCADAVSVNDTLYVIGYDDDGIPFGYTPTDEKQFYFYNAEKIELYPYRIYFQIEGTPYVMSLFQHIQLQ